MSYGIRGSGSDGIMKSEHAQHGLPDVASARSVARSLLTTSQSIAYFESKTRFYAQPQPDGP